MPETLTFSKVHNYDTLKAGITLDVKITFGETDVTFEAKVDTGASRCIFKRLHGEYLGIDVESGTPEKFGTATGGFLAYGHEVTLKVLGIETVSTVYFAAEESFSRNVLGRTGWLDRVRLGLVDHEGKLFLSANDEEG
ncbi:MAG: retropepsin-like domain-containing protein [Acidobacteriota bacterium]|nr:retropepsin-like domain-containing protein [Acidobacteriota bacterium]